MCADGDAVQAAVVFCAHVVLALGNGTVNVVIFLHFHGENPGLYPAGDFPAVRPAHNPGHRWLYLAEPAH